jgi:ligand-binding sensor domain-containing protein
MRVLLFFLLTTFYSLAQNIESVKITSKPFNYEVFWGNDLSGKHFFSKNNTLYKVSKSDTLNYANNNFGKISSVETFNMLQTLVFYKENNAFVLLDAQLNEIKTTIFSEINCEFLKPASQNELWFYDSLSQQIGLYNLNSKKIKFLSNPIKNISYSQSDYNYLYWIDTENNAFSISKFGKIKSLGKITPFEKVVFLSQTDLFYLFEDEIYYYTFENQISTRININEKLIENFCYSDGFFSIFTNNQLITYKIKK